MSSETTGTHVWTDLDRSSILVLDDDDDVRTVVSRCLERERHNVIQARDLSEARAALHAHDVMIVLADVTLRDGESGLDLLSELRVSHPGLPVIVMTANSDVSTAIGALQHGAYDYLCKPFRVELLLAAIERAVAHTRLLARTSLMQHLESRRMADEENLEQFLVSMASVIDAKSRFTAQHSRRVSSLARILAEALDFDPIRAELVALGGRLHDIGKVGTPDAILDKPGPLDAREYEIIKEHPALGDQLVMPIKAIAELRPMIRWHHERLDGKGYPDGLRGDEIPLEAFVIKTADIWEAITSRRPYREPMPISRAVECLRREKDDSIPGELVETFLQAIQGHPAALPLVEPVDARDPATLPSAPAPVRPVVRRLGADEGLDSALRGAPTTPAAAGVDGPLPGQEAAAAGG